MKASELAYERLPDHLYGCDLLPAGRAYWFREDSPGEVPDDVYIRADGTWEAFSWNLDGAHSYSLRGTWTDLGPMPRIDGAPDLAALAVLLA